jgi:hypothetical protein
LRLGCSQEEISAGEGAVMGRDMYAYRLWRGKPWYRGGDQEVASQLQCWVDLRDELDVAQTFAALIIDHGGFLADMHEYRVWFHDLASGEQVGGVTGAVAARALGRADDGQDSSAVPVTLENASDEWLIHELTRITRELARRLRER